MNLDLEKLRELITHLETTKPWHEDNFQLFSFLNQSSEYRRSHSTILPTPEGERDGFLYEVGIANIATLIAGGRSVRELPLPRRKRCSADAAQVAWTLYEGSYLWETAAVADARQLVDVLKVVVPLGTLWDKAYAGLKSRV